MIARCAERSQNRVQLSGAVRFELDSPGAYCHLRMAPVSALVAILA